MKAWVLLLLCLLLCPAWGQAAPDAYQSSLHLYADDTSAPLAVHINSRQAFAHCTLERLTYQSTNGQRVPALLFLPRHVKRPVPCVVALHGFGGSKETLAGWGFYAAAHGIGTFALDLWGQGERTRPGTQINPSTLTPDSLLADLTTGVPQTVQDTRRALDYLQTRPELDKHRLGLVGFSLGAMIGAVAAGVDPRIRAAVLVSGGGDWGVILRSLSGRTVSGKQVAAQPAPDWNALSAALAPVDPMTFAPHTAPRPLLLVNGRRDTTIIPAAAQRLYDAARSGTGARVQIHWLPQGQHIPDTDIVYPLAAQWLQKNLQPGGCGLARNVVLLGEAQHDATGRCRRATAHAPPRRWL